MSQNEGSAKKPHQHVLILHVRKEYFEQIESGEKTEEYRLLKPYWSRYLAKDLTHVMILLGYPSKDEKGKWITFAYNGFTIKKIVNKEFGGMPVDVYAISLLRRISQDKPALS